MQRSQHVVFPRLFLASFALGACGVTSYADAACLSQNTCFGIGALQTNTNGEFNSAFGYEALFSNEEGGTNSAFGWNALRNNVGGGNNTAVGASALSNHTNGTGNTGIGAFSLTAIDIGEFNTAVGYGALVEKVGPEIIDRNTAIGADSLATVSGSHNTAVGDRAMTGGAFVGNTSTEANTAIGSQAMRLISGGQANTGVGSLAMFGAVSTDDETFNLMYNFNTAVGYSAMKTIKSGENNTATGYLALRGGASGIVGNSNTANGAKSLLSITSGIGNTATGFDALNANRTGSRNTANGVDALGDVTSGVRNVGIGFGAGNNIATGSDNIDIGANTAGLPAENGVIRIGTSAFQKKTFVAGIRGVSTGSTAAIPVFIDANGQLGTIKSSRAAKENIQAMGDISERLKTLRPVTFQYKEADEDGSKPLQFGLIAEEVAEAFPELVVYDAEGKPETVSYHLLATLLLNEFQKERGIVEAQATELAQLRKEFAKMVEVVERLDQERLVATNR